MRIGENFDTVVFFISIVSSSITSDKILNGLLTGISANQLTSNSYLT